MEFHPKFLKENTYHLYKKNLKKLIAFFWKYQSREKIESKKFLFLSQTKHKTEKLKKKKASRHAVLDVLSMFLEVFS